MSNVFAEFAYKSSSLLAVIPNHFHQMITNF